MAQDSDAAPLPVTAPTDESRATSIGGRVEAVELDESCDLIDRISALRYRNNLRRVTSSLFTNERLLEWLALEARLAAESGLRKQKLSTEFVSKTASSLRAAAIAARSFLQCIPRWPEYANGRGDRLDDGSMVPCLDLAVAAGLGRELWDEECENWIKLPDGVPRGEYVALRVFGESMEPLLHSGDIILVRVQSHCELGSIVVARSTDGFVVKKLRTIARGIVELESINSSFPRMTIAAADNPVLGTVVVRWCGHSKS